MGRKGPSDFSSFLYLLHVFSNFHGCKKPTQAKIENFTEYWVSSEGGLEDS